jgi:hypothetical protein
LAKSVGLLAGGFLVTMAAAQVVESWMIRRDASAVVGPAVPGQVADRLKQRQ